MSLVWYLFRRPPEGPSQYPKAPKALETARWGDLTEGPGSESPWTSHRRFTWLQFGFMEARCAAATRRMMFFSSFPLFSLLLLAGRYCHSECVEKQEQRVGADHRGPGFVSLFDESGFQLTCPGQEFAAALTRHLQITWGVILSTLLGSPVAPRGFLTGPGTDRSAHDMHLPKLILRLEVSALGRGNGQTAGKGDVKGMKTADVTTARLESP